MRSIRAGIFLLCLVQLPVTAAADVADRKSQEAQAAAKKKLAMPRPDPATVTPVPATPPQVAVPQPPVPITSCDPGGCWGNGNRYSGGAGNTYLDKSGRLCQGNGTWMQCY